jgi:hypothetical protein
MIHRPEKLEAEWETADRLGSFASSLELIDLIRIENLLLELAGNPLLLIMTRSLGLANLPSPGARISLLEASRHRRHQPHPAGDRHRPEFMHLTLLSSLEYVVSEHYLPFHAGR